MSFANQLDTRIRDLKQQRETCHEGRELVLDIVHGSYGILGISPLRIAHEAETATAASISVLDHHLCARKLRIRNLIHTIFRNAT